MKIYDCRNEWKEKYDKLKTSHDKLVEAFEIYGGHLENCNLNSLIPKVSNLNDPPECDCGLDQALKECEQE